MSDAEKQVLLAQQTTDVEALRLLLEAERGSARGSPTPAGPQSRTWNRRRDLVAGRRRRSCGERSARERDSRLLDRYRRAMEDRESPRWRVCMSSSRPNTGRA